MQTTQIVFLVALLVSCSAAYASDGDINKAAFMTALTHTDRDKRSRKFLWLKPGKIIRWHYEWVMADGSTVTKIEEAKAPGVPDRRGLRESHPNLAIVMPVAQAVGNFAGPALLGR